jgi:hypothetical protein
MPEPTCIPTTSPIARQSQKHRTEPEPFRGPPRLTMKHANVLLLSMMLGRVLPTQRER